MRNTLTKLKSNKDINELISKGFSSFALNFFGMILNYIFLYIISNMYGPEEVGVYSLFMAYLSILFLLTALGFHTASLKFISQYAFEGDWASVRHTYKLSFLHIVISSLTVCVLVVIIYKLFYALWNVESVYESLLFSILIALLPFGLFHLHTESLRGLKKINESNLFFHVLLPFFSLIFLLLFHYTGNSNNHISVLSRNLSIWLSFLLIFVYWNITIMNKNNRKPNNNTLIKYSKLFKVASPLFLASSMIIILEKTDIMMIDFFGTKEEVGLYNIALKIINFTKIPLFAIASISAPKIAIANSLSDRNQLKKLFLNTSLITLIASSPFLVFLLAFPKLALSYFGSEFIVAENVLLILIIKQIGAVVFGQIALFFQMTDLQRIFLRIILASAIINVILNYLLIPILNIEGAALASIISEFFQYFFLSYYLFKRYQILPIFLSILNK